MSSQTVPSSVHFGCLRAPLPPPLRSAGVQFHPKGNALRILRSQGLCNEAIHRVYRSVCYCRQTPLCSHSAWWGFTSAAHRHRLEALIKRGIRTGLCSADIPTLTEMTESVDDALFQRIMYNP